MKNTGSDTNIKQNLEELYSHYNRREYVHPDPLEFLYDYYDIHDREIVGMIASSLAYGRVAQILKSVSAVLKIISPSPAEYLMNTPDKKIVNAFIGFKHRFTTDEHIYMMLIGIKKIIDKEGSLYRAFMSGYKNTDENTIPALSAFVERLEGLSGLTTNSLISPPCKGSACKRHHLFLRWMVRRDAVDPGGWDMVDPAKLIIPLDTHMHKLGAGMKMTQRKQGDIRTAIEITDAFKKISPSDPVKYDFSLTRLGIRKEGDPDLFLSRILSHP